MKTARTLIVSAVFVAVAVGVAVWLYPQMPARVATHWGVSGQPNGYSPRFWAATMWPLLIAALAVLTVTLPRISPKRFEMESFAGVYGVLMLVIQGVMLVLGVTAMLAGAGHAVPMATIAPLGVGVLLIVLGNYMGKLRRNFFVGIRTPWTLASEAAWERTHRLAGWVYVLAGAAMVVLGLIGAMAGWMLAAVVVVLLIPHVCSYFIYRRLEGHHSSEGDSP
ncbi:SdpI family protein [Rhodanobacter sp. 7MK24]|uniref:SdpI family protein n=1 Tax=Rhodanobacter sp. 7MK24 TaxID=2775922 RepID=UPI00178658E6|nr:SdpI family protein [Rhodanobacter sp. 7MK24]MBD8880428.1 SdpI family protein [Rhodanobacter sp. 7MK24]